MYRLIWQVSCPEHFRMCTTSHRYCSIPAYRSIVHLNKTSIGDSLSSYSSDYRIISNSVSSIKGSFSSRFCDMFSSLKSLHYLSVSFLLQTKRTESKLMSIISFESIHGSCIIQTYRINLCCNVLLESELILVILRTDPKSILKNNEQFYELRHQSIFTRYVRFTKNDA